MKFFCQYPDGTDATAKPVVNVRGRCQHRGTKLSVAPCCGQMFACTLHKGQKCAPVGIAKDPFLSCSICADYVPFDPWPQRTSEKQSVLKIGFLSAAFTECGGTETFHCTLIPRLKSIVDVAGFVATAFYGGDGASLGVPYETGIDAARRLATHANVVVTWGISDLQSLLPAIRPRVIAVHHADSSSDWSNQTILSQLDLIDEVVCVNADAAQHLSQQIDKPVHHIPNAVDPERIVPSGRQSELRTEFGIAADSRIVLFGHRLSAEKRPAFAVEIAKRLPNGWTMVIAGDGPEMPHVQRSAAGTHNVRVVGRCDNLADWLAISDCFLSLSTFEGFGLSIAEAMLAGVPTVSTPTGIAPGLAMTLPTESNAEEWAAAIASAQQLTPAAKIAEMFSVDRMVSDWASMMHGRNEDF